MAQPSPQYPLYSDSLPTIAAPLQDSRLSNDLQTNLDSPDVLVTQIFVDLSDIMVHLHEHNRSWQTIQIYADQLYIPSTYLSNTFVVQLSGKSLTIHCRELFAPSPSGSFSVFKNDFNFTCYARHITGALYITHISQGPRICSNELTINPGFAGVRLVSKEQQDEISQLATFPPDQMSIGSPLYWILRATFIIARQLTNTRTILARDMSVWIVEATKSCADLVDLNSQSYVLYTHVTDISKGLHVVPYLNESLYERAAKGYLDVAKDYEDRYNSLEDLQASTDQHLRFVRATLASGVATESYLDSLVNLSQDTLNRMLSNKKDALDDAKAQRRNVDLAKSAYDQGVRRYEEQKTLDAVFAIVSAVATIAASVASIAVGNVAGAASAAGAVDGVASAAKGIAEATKAVSAASKVAKVIEKLKKAFETMEKIQESFKSIQDAADAVDSAKTQVKATIPVPIPENEEMNDADWEVFALNVEGMMEFSISEGIDGASDYQRELKILAVRSKAYVDISSAVVKAQTAYLRDVLSRNHQRRLGKIVTDLQNGLLLDKDHDKMIQMLLWEHLLNLRGWAVTQIDEKIRAFQYWALDTNTAALEGDMKDDVSTLKTMLATIEARRISVLQNFNPPPQNFRNIVIDLGSKPRFLRDLQRNGKASYTLPLSERALQNFGRVRVSHVRVLINTKAITDQQKSYMVVIKTSGTYLDRNALGATFSFVGKAMAFGYSQNIHGDVAFDNGPGASVRADSMQFFQPTAFTTWQLNIEGVPFSNITASLVNDVKLVLDGSAILLTQSQHP